MRGRSARHRVPRRTSPAPLLICVILLLLCMLWGLGLNEVAEKPSAPDERVQPDLSSVVSATLTALSSEYRTAHYSLLEFAEAAEIISLSEARAALGPVTRLAASIVEQAGEGVEVFSLVDLLEHNSHRLIEVMDKMADRFQYYGEVQQFDLRSIEALAPELLVIADSLALTAGRGDGEDAALQRAHRALERIALCVSAYLDMGTMPEAKPEPVVDMLSAAETARAFLMLPDVDASFSASETYNNWQGVHIWELTFHTPGRDVSVLIDASTALVRGYILSGHNSLDRSRTPAMSRGEALAVAKSWLPIISNVPARAFMTGRVEFDGSWKVTFWPKIDGVVLYSHPATVYVDPIDNQPYGYHSLRELPATLPMPQIRAEDATELAKTYAQQGFMKEAFTAYRGSTYLAVVRSPITAEDTLVWAAEFVISSRYHQSTGYDMALCLVNAHNGRYEGTYGLGDGRHRIDWWQRR